MSLSRYEQETIVNFNEEEATAVVYTHNKALARKLVRLAPGEAGGVPPGEDHP